ncbi:hypothetical protein [Halomicrococcus sp. NG-SE-24]|uniref:hypothetical protein n=1 Tax=Halomicrococcus sp. NG-SE-24 TaxID=3436928 RepID=UPI003D9700DD
MRRRTLLAGVAAGLLSGCVGSPGTGSGPEPAGSTTGGTTTSTTTNDGTTTAVPPDARYAVTNFSVETEKVAPTAKYALETTKVYSREAALAEVDASDIVDVSELPDPDMREAIAAAIRDGKLRTDDVPAGLDDALERYAFFTGVNADGSTHTHYGLKLYRLSPSSSPQLRFDARPVDRGVAPDDPGEIAFAVTNEGETTQEIFSGTVPPFGVLRAEARDADRQFLLWRDYEEEGCAQVENGRVRAVCDIGKLTPVEPGETVTKRYELRPGTPGMESGSYVVDGTLSYSSEMQEPSTEVEWAVNFALEAR